MKSWHRNGKEKARDAQQVGLETRTAEDEYLPPPGPPPSSRLEEANEEPAPPPYDPWMAIPDTSLLPPPPTLANDTSPTANASANSADQAIAWCLANPLFTPGRLSATALSAIHAGHISLTHSPHTHATLSSTRAGTSTIRSRPGCPDTSLSTMLPLFSALHDGSALARGQSKTIYFEIRVLRLYCSASSADGEEAVSGVALGFAAPPYPSSRLPGWERASLAVHGDDGRRYVSDNRGGRDFTTAFAAGEVVGLGMRFRGAPFVGQRGQVEVFFTREGRQTGTWDLFEERDEKDWGSVDGLDGSRDLLGVVGLFGGVEVETRFRRDEWLFRQ